MESKARLIAKAVTWQVTGLFAMTLIGFLITGSVAQGGVVAAAGAVSGFVFYILHEGLWNRVRWGRDWRPRSLVDDALATPKRG